ncbi:MAG: alpha/beta hydrolase-fold protein [Verrucomicrobiales bacterium]|nr:alpha/beta hydrolase-fold protein [Verrucomicrobiales bacterium]
MNRLRSFLFLSVVFSLVSASPLSAQNKAKAKKKPAPFAWNNPPSAAWLEKSGLPSGLRHATFASPSMGVEVGYFIYLPDAYEAEADRAFPVVFHLHGGRPGSEMKSIKLSGFVDQAVRNGDIQPTIYVFPNGGPMSWYNYPQIDNGQGEDVFVKELIPHIQKSYRTRELALEGFSQGGRGTTRIMFRYPELFVSAAPGGSGYEPEKRIQENEGAESEKVVFARGDNTWDLAAEYAKREDREKLPILLWVGTKGFNYEYNLKFSDCLKSLGIPHSMHVVEGVAHSAYGIFDKDGLPLLQFHQENFAKPADRKK